MVMPRGALLGFVTNSHVWNFIPRNEETEGISLFFPSVYTQVFVRSPLLLSCVLPEQLERFVVWLFLSKAVANHST